ncbi:MAG: DUF1844 domain-containing protein [Candidatus Marinimicrobia bacterium]|jgi:hypothetical protein|nr:DUF1844 domain-containing protein [Candidatus Neomarinimicrobiota bacterium]MDP6611494.1 DUF1844 domain-containing protein [Candidatus Neomarinimicrobiota bacterium]|tara:strand:+ start:22506 stop:22958 length:453 start_codon:yes stop_codon:yes gene_type:complete
MAEEQLKKEDQLFIHLVNTFVQSAWISLGKVKNPVSDKLERNLEQATYYIDLLDMLQTKMKGNLSEWEEQYIIHSLSELKLNFIDEQKKRAGAPEDSGEPTNSEGAAQSDESGETSDAEKTVEAEPKEEKPKSKKKTTKSPKATKNEKKD